jgi:DNA segregation ATPase FtsK/SpoIIIE, S-DNA-T family
VTVRQSASPTATPCSQSQIGRAALGEEIRQHPDASPVLLNDPAYVGVAVTSLPGRPGFHRARTPQVDHHQVAAIIRATAGLLADPAELLAEQVPGLRVVPPMPAPGVA